MKNVFLIGYSGHAYVVAEILELNNFTIIGYLENEEKANNPFDLKYLGSENNESILHDRFLNNTPFFTAIGNNLVREKIYTKLIAKNFKSVNAIHPYAVVSKQCGIDDGVLVAAGAILNPFCFINKGSIINTGCIIEHECVIGEFSHIAPGAVLAGNVEVGKRTFIGANATIRQGAIIGNDVIIGAGAVVLNNIDNNVKVAGNPALNLK